MPDEEDPSGAAAGAEEAVAGSEDQPAPAKGAADPAPAPQADEGGDVENADSNAPPAEGTPGKEGEDKKPPEEKEAPAAPLNAVLPLDDRSTVKKSVFLPQLRMQSSKIAFLRVIDAEKLFATSGYVSVGGNRGVHVHGVDYGENKIEVLVADISGDEVTKGSVIVNEGTAPGWQWLRGKGGYDGEYDAWVLRHSTSGLVLELGYGCMRVRRRPGEKVQFLSNAGAVMADSGTSWNRREDGTYDESWLSAAAVQLCETTDEEHPYGGGHPFPKDIRFGVWEVEVSDKKLVMLRNHNVTYSVEQGAGKEPLKRPITLLLNHAGHMLFISKSDKCITVGASGNIKYLDKRGASELARRFWKETS